MQQQPHEPNRVNTASPFPTPSSSPGAMSLPPDSDWSGGSEFSLGGSAQSSRAPSPMHPPMRFDDPLVAAKMVNYACALVAQMAQGNIPQLPPLSQLPSPCPTPAPSEPSSSRPASPAVQSTPKRKIPRSANAFMLYRSHLIKTGQIPKSVESRQQNISRVAGQCWNILSDEQRKPWHDLARELALKHKEMYPDYKFSPERKQSRRKNPLGEGPPMPTGEDYIRLLREKYVGISGPPVAPPRPRKSKSRRGTEAQAQSAPPPMHFPIPPTLPPSPAGTPDIPRVSSAPPYLALPPEAHLAAMGAHGFPDYSAFPPPGPGFPHNFPSEYFAQYLTPAVQQDPQGVGSTFQVPTFNDPTQARFTFRPPGEGPSGADLGLAPPHGAVASASTSQSQSQPQPQPKPQPQPQPQRQEGPAPSRPTSPSRWDGLDSYLVPPILGDSSSPHDALHVSLDAHSAYGTDPAGSLDNSELDAWY